MSNDLSKFQRSIDVNGKTFTVNILPAKKGLPIALKLVKTIGPALAKFAESANQGEIAYTEIATELLTEMDSLDVMSIIEQLMNGYTVDGKEVPFDFYFTANYGELVEVLTFAIKENFGSFFEASALKSLSSTFKAE